MQLVLISGPKVAWGKMGTWKVIDNEPDPPTHPDYGADKGWKMVTNLIVSRGGGDFIIPKDQIMLVTHIHAYTTLHSLCTSKTWVCGVHVLIHHTFIP
jgi:hypothetical protein